MDKNYSKEVLKKVCKFRKWRYCEDSHCQAESYCDADGYDYPKPLCNFQCLEAENETDN